MSANSRFAVATHLVTVLAFAERSAEGSEPVSSETLAQSVNTSAIVVRRLLGSLHEAGLVKAYPGRRGGVLLGRSPKQISLLDIHQAIDDPSIFMFSRNPPNPGCPIGSCVTELLERVFDGVQQAVDAELGKTRISDLLERADRACSRR